MSGLDPERRFSEEDAFLFAVLGLIAGCRRVDASLGGGGGEVGPDDDIAHALLGAIRLRGLVEDVVTSWAGEAREVSREPAVAAGHDALEDVLR